MSDFVQICINVRSVLAPSSKALVTRSDALVTSSFLLLVARMLLVASLLLIAMPGAPSSFLLLVVRPGAPSSVRPGGKTYIPLFVGCVKKVLHLRGLSRGLSA